jgi:hypothetical protein
MCDGGGGFDVLARAFAEAHDVACCNISAEIN